MSRDILLTVENLEFKYTNSASAYGFSLSKLELSAGEMVLLQGPSGIGKSTFLNLLLGLIPPSAGVIKFKNESLGQLSGQARDKWRADHVGVIYQHFNLIPYLSAYENVQLSSFFSLIKKDKSKNLDQEIKRLFKALDFQEQLMSQKAAEMSMGQQQRVAAARALLGSPELLIADEPTSHLDPLRRDQFMELVTREVKSHGITLLMVTHDVGVEKYFDRTIQFSEVARLI